MTLWTSAGCLWKSQVKVFVCLCEVYLPDTTHLGVDGSDRKPEECCWFFGKFRAFNSAFPLKTKADYITIPQIWSIFLLYFWVCICFGYFRWVPVQQCSRWDVQETIRGPEPHQLPVRAGLWQLCWPRKGQWLVECNAKWIKTDDYLLMYTFYAECLKKAYLIKRPQFWN